MKSSENEMRNLIDSLATKTLGFANVQEYKEYRSRMDKHQELIEVLRDDWLDVTELLRESEELYEDNIQLNRRTLVRTLFAFVEGTLYAMKQQILVEYSLDRVQLSPAEFAILSEEAYTLKESGLLRAIKNYLQIKANVKFTLPFFAEKNDTNFEFTPSLKDNPIWQDFCSGVEIRNRLMHPKALEDLNVKDEEIESIVRTGEWFVEQIETISDRIFQPKLEQFKRLASEDPRIEITDEGE